MRFQRFLLFVPLALSLAACANSTRVTDDPAALRSHQRDVQRGVFTVKGSVFHPGTFSIKQGESMTLAEALKRAGGTLPGDSFDNGASLSNIRVSRIKYADVVNYRLDVRNGADGQNFLIKAGDQIYVPEVIF